MNNTLDQKHAQLLSDILAALAILAADGLEDSPLAAFLRACLARAG